MSLQENTRLAQLRLMYKATNTARNEPEVLAIVFTMETLTAKLWGLSLF